MVEMENEVALFDFVFALSEAIDLASPALNNHHKKVAYIAFSIAEEMRLTNDMVKDVMLAALLHDIGAFSLSERLRMRDAVIDDMEITGHAEMGYMLLKDLVPLQEVATMIRYHHVVYEPLNVEIPLGAYVIHLADRVALQFDDKAEILGQIPTIMAKIDELDDKFHPKVFAALKRLAKLECFWIEAWGYPGEKLMPERIRASKDISDMGVLQGFAQAFAQAIDFRSRFTAAHSSGVAAVAREMAVLAGFSPRECGMMEIAGYLHDLGKLAVPNTVLEKDGRLNRVEFSIIQKHSYYTYVILNKIKGMELIAEWAAFHHERMDGNGYPFHIKGDRLSKLSRIMAASDVFTAITEDRPYRVGMKKEQAVQILAGMVDNGGLDGEAVRVVQDNFDHINEKRTHAQEAALRTYGDFYAYGSSPAIRKMGLVELH